MKGVNRTVITFLLAGTCLSATAAPDCNQRVDAFAMTNELLFLEQDEALAHLSKQGVHTLKRWSCQDWEGEARCEQYRRHPQVLRFDKQGRLVERADNGKVEGYRYEGASMYPSEATRQSNDRPAKTEELSPTDDNGVPAKSPEWRYRRNGTVDYRREDGMVSAHFVNGRFQSGTKYVSSLNGLDPIVIGAKPSPLKDQYRITCDVKNEADGVTLVTSSYTASLDGSMKAQSWRYDKRGNQIWHRSARGVETRYITLTSDKKGNWLSRKLQRQNGSAMLEYRTIEYYD